MTVLSIPSLEEEPWPTLGPKVCQWIERNLVFGPGDLRGQPAKLDPEKRGLIYSFYEIYPRGAKDANGKLIEGRRRFRRCAVSLQKGSAKTELAAWIAAAELHPDAPVRFDHFDGHGTPWGHGVIDPYIPLVAYTEEQSEDLAYSALKTILELCPVASAFDIGLERIIRAGGDGKAVALAAAPDSRDGARTTFSHKDETHRWNLERLRRAHRTMLANLPKRLLADPWELETTTAYVPGENSVAEQTANYAKDVAEGKIKDSRLFFFHRQASDGYDWSDATQRRDALVEAAGPTATWKDIEGISEQWQDPDADKSYLERVYGNRPIATAAQAFNVAAWNRNAAPRSYLPGVRPLIVIGFDGSLKDDSTFMNATDVSTGYQFTLGAWEKPLTTTVEWEVPKAEVMATFHQAFEDFDVLLVYVDPSKWETEFAQLAGRYGSKRIVAWPTTLYRKMAVALKAYSLAIEAGDVEHDGDPRMARHIGNSQKNVQNFRDDDGSPLWLIQKDRPFSPNKIDGAFSGCLSWRARLDVLATGILNAPPAWSGIYIPEDEETTNDQRR